MPSRGDIGSTAAGSTSTCRSRSVRWPRCWDRRRRSRGWPLLPPSRARSARVEPHAASERRFSTRRANLAALGFSISRRASLTAGASAGYPAMRCKAVSVRRSEDERGDRLGSAMARSQHPRGSLTQVATGCVPWCPRDRNGYARLKIALRHQRRSNTVRTSKKSESGLMTDRAVFVSSRRREYYLLNDNNAL